MAVSAERALQHWFDQARVAPLGEGHIHDTYEVTAPSGHFVLQSVNHQVFADPELVMRQTGRVLQQWRQQTEYVVPALVAARDGSLAKWIDGEYWRVWEFIADTRVVDPIANTRQALQAGKAFGALQRHLGRLPGPQLIEPIPGFLQLRHYLQAYDLVANGAPRELHALVDRHRHLADELGQRNTTIHGDCKINNLLFDSAAQQVVAVIDFDTVMHGHWAWDFGDLVRSVCFSRGAADVGYFAAALQGFASEQPACTVTECLAAPGYVTLMLGVRFLTDHLQGDRYFRVSHRGENLARANEQFALFESFLSVQHELREAAAEILRTL
jgi:Ser/Thr protein kinase RdoA (MazF antagonist)